MAASTTVIRIRKILAPTQKNSTSHTFKELPQFPHGIMTLPYHKLLTPLGVNKFKNKNLKQKLPAT